MTRPDASAPDPTARYYDGVAETYDALLNAMPGDRWARDAFRAWVVSHLPSRATVFDFGCGTGTDAHWYADLGWRVFAHDNAPRMMREMETKCRRHIDRGQIVPVPEGLAGASGVVDAVTANFAVLNHLDRVDTFFSEAAAVVGPAGQVVVSIQNPWFWKDLVRRQIWRPGWWTEALHAGVRGAVRLPLDYGTLHQHTLRGMRRAAEPHFSLTDRAGIGTLVRHGRGAPNWETPQTPAQRWEKHLWRTGGVRSLGRYQFLVFTRRNA